MKRSKEQKGVTLVALIITIVVLLILAVVAIAAIQNDGIIGHTYNAVTKYKEAQENEQILLDQYEDYIESESIKWTQNKTTVTNGTVILEVGTIVTGYDETKDKYGKIVEGIKNVGWYVLGAENGKLLLISDKNVQNEIEFGAEDYVNNGQKLKDICIPYGQGVNAVGARSVKVEDINKVTGFDPLRAENNDEPYNSGNIYQYGNIITYTLKDGKVAYTSNIESGTSNHTKFMLPDGRELGVNGLDSIKLKCDFYGYDSDIKGLSTNSLAHKALFGYDQENIYYLLDSTCITADAGNAGFALRRVDGYGCGAPAYIGEENVWWSEDGEYTTTSFGARAVVILKSNVNIDSTGKIS